MPLRHLLLVPFAVVVAILAGCTDGDEAETTVTSAPTGSAPDEPPTTGSDDEPEAEITDPTEAADAPDPSAAAPAVRLPVDPDADATNWVGRTYMDDERVELTWSTVDDAEQYLLYRLPTATADYARLAEGVLDDAVLVYEGGETETIDDDVPADTFLTYVLVAEVNGGFTEPRWTEALTTVDTTPPTAVEDLRVTVSAEGVLLEWTASSDDVEFAAYAVTYRAEDGSWQYIGGGADENQTSFLDNEPRPGLNTYEVTAFDFHENGSDSARIEVTVGQP